MSTINQQYIIRERVALSEKQRDALTSLLWDSQFRQPSRVRNARTRGSLIERKLVAWEERRGPRGGRKIIHKLTPEGARIANRINDEAEGVTSGGLYIILCDRLPEGMKDGEACDENGKALAADAHGAQR
jgi:hypothetical protein